MATSGSQAQALSASVSQRLALEAKVHAEAGALADLEAEELLEEDAYSEGSSDQDQNDVLAGQTHGPTIDTKTN